MAENQAYVEQGKGKDVVLLHGFCESKAIWQPLMNASGPHARLLVTDLKVLEKILRYILKLVSSRWLSR